MNRDDILRLYEKANGWKPDGFERTVQELERFAALVVTSERKRVVGIAKDMREELQAEFEQAYMEGVIAGAAAEREACIKACDAVDLVGADECIAAIRARGQA
jgi:hypothetical protein